MSRKIKNFNFILGFLLFIQIVYSFNFGAVAKSNYQKIPAEGSAQFTILLWNLGENSYFVTAELKDQFQNWEIIVRPQNFILEPTKIVKPPYEKNIEYIKIPGKGNAEADVLRVFIKTPKNVEPGIYDLNLILKAGNPGEQISIFQEKEINLKVEVEGKTSNEVNDIQLRGEKTSLDGIKNKITGMVSSIPFNSVSAFFIGLAILLTTIFLTTKRKK